MKPQSKSAAIFLLLSLLSAPFASAQHAIHPKANPAAGPGSVIVQGKLGGLIFGFDIDQNGNLGVLSEAKILNNGTVQASVQTFDQATGTIVKVVTKSQTMDDFITLGIVGNSIGLIEREHPISLFKVQRAFRAINPLSSGRLNSPWTPPIDQQHIITEASRLQGGNTAFLATDVSGTHIPVVFSSDVAANTFSPVFQVTDNDFNFETDPVLAYNSATNQAFLGHNTNSPFIVPPKVAIIDLSAGTFTKFTGLGLGLIDGIAVDPQDNIICTTTSFDPDVQFYNLNTRTSINVVLPNANELDGTPRGQAVEFDPVNKLFLVAQPFTSTGPSGSSSIQVYDIDGTFVESIDGLRFNGTGNVFPVHIALNPAQRSGFVDGPATTVTQIQSFTY
jgi:WD40 repeat protein